MRLISAILALGLMSGSALAADLLEPMVPVEPVIVPEAFSWTGGYVGLNAGWAFGADWDDADDDLFDDNDDDRRRFWRRHRGDNDFDLNGPFLGAQAGFNFQTGMFVLGVEGDIQWANIDSNDDGFDGGGELEGRDIFTGRVGRLFTRPVFQRCAAKPNCEVDFDERFTSGGITDGNAEVDWFGTLRLRGGIALDRTLIYATGGLAFGDADFTAPVIGRGGGFQRAVAQQGRPCLCRLRVLERVGFRGVESGGDDDVSWGWALGGGVEHAFTDNVSIKAEYQYVNLNTEEHRSDIVAFRQFTIQRKQRFNNGDLDPVHRRNEFRIPFGRAGGHALHTLRVGMNVLF